MVLRETRERRGAAEADIKKKINDLAMNLIGAPVDDIVLAPPHTVPKTRAARSAASRARLLRAAPRCEAAGGAAAVRLAWPASRRSVKRGWRVVRG